MKYDVCVFGGCSLDQTFFQRVDGGYDDNPNSYAPGGKGSNQVVAAARAGAKTTIITRIGKDKIGQSILENLKVNQVDVSNLEMINDLQNDYANIYINIKDKDNEIERFTGASSSFTPDMVDNYKDVLLNSKIIACQLKIPKEVSVKLINFCYENNKTLVLTPCKPDRLKITDSSNLELIEKISILICNKTECMTVFDTDDIESCVKKYPNKLIVTLGKDGLIYYNGKRIVRMPAISVDVIDTTGAGDTLCGNLCAFLAKGMDLRHSLRKAMYASTMKLTEKTAQAGMPYLEDLDKFIFNCRHKDFTYGKELNLALLLVRDAYDSVRYNDKFRIETKQDNSLVTDVDLAIENYMLDKIKSIFPNDNFVTEENCPDNKILDRTWIVDPIDGTSHFIKKDGLWGIQLAFYDASSVKFSVIYLPEQGNLYYAAENQGAFLNNNKIFVKNDVPLNQSIVEFGGSIYVEMDLKEKYLRKLMDNGKLSVANVLHINSCCISYSNLVSGKTDALIISTKKPWDIMPGEFMCKECGLTVQYLDFDKKLRLITASDSIKDKLFD